MPDFSNFTTGITTSGTPYGAPSGASFGDTSGVTPDMQKIAASASYGSQNDYGTVSTIAGDIGFAPVDLADTVASSIPFLSKAAGIQRGDLNNAVLNAIGSPGLRDFYEKNKGGIQIASGIGGIIAADFATAGLAGAAPLVGLLSKASWGRKALALDGEYQNAKKAVQVADQTLASQGLMGSSLFTSEMGLSGARVLSEAGLDPALATVSRSALVRKAAGLGAAKSVLRAAGTEAVAATTLNQNDFLYSADIGSNIAFAALGLGVAGLVGNIGTKYAIRKFTNTDAMRRITAGALDPTGQMSAMTAPSELAKGPFKDVVDNTYLGTLQGAKTDRITSLYTSARSEVPQGVDKSTFSRIQTQYEKLGQEEIQKVTTKGISGVNGTGFSTGTQGYGNHVYEMMHNDPGAMLGVEMAGGIGEGMSITGTHAEFGDNLSQRLLKTQEMIADKDNFAKLSPEAQAATFGQLKQLKFMQTLVPTPVIDGEVTTMATAQAFDNWVNPVIKSSTEDGLTTWMAHEPGGKTRNIGLDSQGNVFLPGKQTVNNAGMLDMLNLYRAGQQRIASIARDPEGILQLADKPDWFHLDMAESLLQKNPQATVQWPAGMTRESARVESFAQKVDAIKGLKETFDGDTAALLRVRYNLPRLSAYEAGLLQTSDTPLDVLLRGAIQKGGGNAIRQLAPQELVDGMRATRDITGDLAGRQGTKADTTMGNTFNFLTDSNGQPTNPMLMYRRPFMTVDYMADNLAERLAIKKAQTMKGLVTQQSGPMTRDISALIASSADTQLASGVNELSDAQLMSSIPGLGGQAPSSPFGRLPQGVITAEMRARDTPNLLAAIRLRETVDRTAQASMKNLFEQHLGDKIVVLNGPRNTASKFMMNQFHSFAGGWDLAEKPVKTALADGSQGWAFPLEDTVSNHKRYQALFEKEMPSGATLMNPKGQQITLDDMGLNVQQGFNNISDQLRNEKNALLDSLGLPTISRKPWYTPPANTEGKFVGFTFDAENNIVPGGTVIANTEESFNRIRAKLAADPDSIMNRPDHRFSTQNEVKEFATLMDKAQMDMMSPGRTFIQGAKANEGHLLTSQVNLAAFDDSLKSMRNELLQHGRDVMETFFHDQLQAAKARSAISGGEQTQGGKAFGFKDAGKNIFDYYTEAVTGRSPIASEKSVIGRIQDSLEKPINTLLRPTGAAANQAWNAAKDYITQVNPFIKSDQQKSMFEKLQAKLGDQMPFDSVSDLMAARGYGAQPATLKQLQGATGRFEATWILRMMEPMQAVMNLTGVLNAAPAVVRHLTMQSGEDAASYAQRVGHSATIFGAPDGAQYGVLDMGKLAWRGFQRAWSGTADADFQRLASKGMLSQEMAEFQKAFNAADNRSGWDLFMNGNPTSQSKFGQKGLVGWLSWMTDKSEDFSRSWAHMIGDDVGQQLGISDTVARDNFAHDIANKMIANYNPLNRPAIFQGALGTPIGLFQGFIWAYYQRLFRYLETGDARAMATQYATQAASFGLKTVPGFNEINQMWFNHSDGKNSPYDEIYKRFGADAGDALMGGVWGNLPKLLGGKAIDLSSRGDTTFRTPVLNPPAIFTTAGKIKKGIGEAIGLFGQNNPAITGTQIAEILSNTIPNRPMANIIEQFGAGGNDTDNTGQLVAKSHDWFDTTARVLGTRTMTESNDQQAFYSNKQAAEIRAQQRETLTANTRSLIRSGQADDVHGVFEAYVAGGGDPRYYKTWVKQTFKSATETRSQRQVETLMHNPANQALVDRMLGAQTGIAAEASQPEPSESMGVQDSMLADQPTNSALDNTQMMYGGPGYAAGR